MKTSNKAKVLRGLWLRGKTYWLDAEIDGWGRVRISLKTNDAAAALQKAREIRAFPERHLGKDVAENLLECFLTHQERRGISKARRDFARIVLSEMAQHSPDNRLQSLSVMHANRWWVKVTARLAAKSAKDYLGQAVVFYKWAESAGHVHTSPVALIIPPKVRPTPRRTFLSAEDAQRVLNECNDEDLKFALFCALHCGLRRGEVIAARPRWFDLKAGLLHVQNEIDWLTKDRDNRTIPLTMEFQAFLKDYGIRSPYMLRPEVQLKDTNKTWRYRTDFAKQFNNHMERLGLTENTFHDLRRTFASVHASHGTPLYHISKWLGDDPSVVEKTYAHLVPSHDRINGPWESLKSSSHIVRQA